MNKSTQARNKYKQELEDKIEQVFIDCSSEQMQCENAIKEAKKIIDNIFKKEITK